MKESQERVREEQEINWKKLKRQLWLIGLSTLGVFVGFRYLLPLIFPFLIAYLIARLIMPLVFFLRDRLHFPLIVSSIFSLILSLSILGGGFFYLGTILLSQLKNLINDIPLYTKAVTNSMNSVCGYFDYAFRWEKGQTRIFLDDNMNSVWGAVRDVVMPVISQQTLNILVGLFALISVLLIICIAIINLIEEYEDMRDKYKDTDFYHFVSPVTTKLGKVGYAYLKTQLVIMSINSVLLVAAFMWTGSKYSVLAGVGIAVLDAFPVLGSGLFLVPLALFKLLSGKYFAAAILLTAYILCEVIRSFIEPRLLGGRIGLRPFFTLVAMFVGFRLFGVIGFLAGPVGLIIIKTIVEEGTKAGGA